MFLSKLGYSELVQRLFEKMTFFLVDPLRMDSILFFILSCLIFLPKLMAMAAARKQADNSNSKNNSPS